MARQPSKKTLELRGRVAEAYARLGDQQKVAEELGLNQSTISRHLAAVRDSTDPVIDGRVETMETEKRPLPKRGKVARYILTCAQNNTKIYGPLWRNLRALAEHYGAEILVSRFTYNKAAYGKLSVKPGTTPDFDDLADLWYADEIHEHVCDQRVELAPTLVFCGEMNILPTAKRPLQGFETYTGVKSGVFPHVKIAMESVASAKRDPTKFNYTTGTVTQRNYIQKTAGLKAEFHHCYGALLVEVDHEGRWWTRQLNQCEKTRTIYDLDIRAKDGKITRHHRVEGVTWGDIHEVHVDHETEVANWLGNRSIYRILRPRYQFIHDVVHFLSRNHHDRRDPHLTFLHHCRGQETVEDEIGLAAGFLKRISTLDPVAPRPPENRCQTVVVRSNHDEFLARWLRETDYRFDPVNAVFFLRAQLAVYEAIKSGMSPDEFNVLEWSMRALGCPEVVRFLATDESFVICPGRGGGVECGMHGHLGPDGARGNPGNLSRMGRKANVGHTHKAGILDGMYTAGVTGALDQGYNKGPSTWSHSHVVTYPNGKRTILTVRDGRWRAW